MTNIITDIWLDDGTREKTNEETPKGLMERMKYLEDRITLLELKIMVLLEDDEDSTRL